jgi:hypothetical protein
VSAVALGVATAGGDVGDCAAAREAEPKRPPIVVTIVVATKRLGDRLIVVVTEISLIERRRGGR